MAGASGVVRERNEREGVSRQDRRSAFAGTAVLTVTAIVCLLIPSSLTHFKRITGQPSFVQDSFYKQAYLRWDTVLAGVFLGSYLLVPVGSAVISRLRSGWRSAYTYAALLGICGALWFLVVHFGRHQFDGFDFNIMIDLGWRQVLGQQPYVDFPATTPPGFHLGVKYAFQLFGVNWDAQLYLCAIFACVTFPWMFWEMTQLSMGRLSSATVAFAIECAAMLTHCYWSYNDTTLILAAVFFLSCLLYISNPMGVAVQASYCASLMLLALFKGNMAGLTIAGAVTLLFLSTARKARMVLLTMGAAVGATTILLLNHVPIGAMLKSYLGVAGRRGSITVGLAYGAFSPFERHSSVFWICVLSLPLLGVLPQLVKRVRQRDWRGIASALLFPLSLLIVIYGLRTNGDLRDLECTALLAAVGVVTFGLRWNGKFLSRITIAILCASIAGDLYFGASRIEIYQGGPHIFFEWTDNNHRIESGFLKNMRVGGPMVELQREIKQAVDSNPGPYFFGPRIDFNYAVQGLPSPKGFPVAWCPETFFPIADEPKIMENWREDHLRTLIFLKDQFAGSAPGGAYTYYPQEFLDLIRSEYVRDDRYPDVTVYRLRVPAA